MTPSRSQPTPMSALAPVSVVVMMALLTIAAPVTARSDEPALTLEVAIHVALERNHRLLAEGAGLEAARSDIEAARAARLPRLDAVASFQNTDNPVHVFGNRLRQGTFTEQDFALGRLNDPDALDNYGAQLVLSQPLWAGGRIASAIAIAVGREAAASSQQERVRQEVVHQVVEAYSAAVLAKLQLEAANQTLESARAQVALARDQYEAGLVVESDPLLAEVRESEVRELVIRAESAVRTSRAALNLVLGRPLDTPTTLPADLADDARDLDDNPARLTAIARTRRPDLEAARQQVVIAESRLAQARSARRPELGLDAAWETNDRDFFGLDQDNYSVMVGLRIPIFRGGAHRAAIVGAEQGVRRAQESALQLEDSIALEVVQLHSEALASTERLEQAQRGLALAERSLTIVQDRYREGLATLPELLVGELALTRSRLQVVATRRDQILTRAALDLATGVPR